LKDKNEFQEMLMEH